MKIQAVKSDDRYIWATIVIDDMYAIDLTFTIYFSTRVMLRLADDEDLLCNWCAGKETADILYLVNALLGYIESEKVDTIPFCSWEKPYMNDEKFVATIKPYYKTIYFTNVKDLILRVDEKKTVLRS